MLSGARSAVDVVRVRRHGPQRETRGHDGDRLTGLEPREIGGGQGERVVVRSGALDAVGLVDERIEVRGRNFEGVAVIAAEVELAASVGDHADLAVAAAAATPGEHQGHAAATHLAKEEFAGEHRGLLLRTGATVGLAG